MPEFFEVKRIKDYLNDTDILTIPITSVSFKNHGERILKQSNTDFFREVLINNCIQSIQTKAKYTLFCLNHGSILLYYRFTGIPHVEGHAYGNRLKSIYSLPIINLNPNHIRFSIYFSNGNILNYYDTRCLSHMHIHKSYQSFCDYSHLNKLAGDLFYYIMPDFNDFISNHNHLKCDEDFLLDQTKPPSGIGNYLANEICAHSNLNPWIKISDMNESQYTKLKSGLNSVIDCCECNPSYDWFLCI